MYLSKIMINGTGCRNAYEIHQALWTLFPENADANRDFLFCVRRSSRNRIELLMQSVREPKISSKEVQIIACRKYSPPLRIGQRLRFLLIANPVKTINDEDGRQNAKGGPKKCRVPIIREEEQRAWLVRKFNGAALFEKLIIDPALPLRFRKTKEDRIGKIQPVGFQGILKVIGPNVMSDMVQKGISPAKAFGCGLMLMRPIIDGQN